MNIIYLRTQDLAPRANNARTHTDKQIKQIARSIEAFGFTNPILVDETSRIIAGHGRVRAAQQLGIERVPTICLRDLSQEQIRAYVIADNRLAELAGWDDEILGIEFKYMAELEIDTSFDLTLTGFEIPEIDLLIQQVDKDIPPEEEATTLSVAEGPAVTRHGDIWRIGRHRLICGDATCLDSYERLLSGEKAQMVFSDAPYNVPIAGHVGGKGAIRHREFAMATGEMSSDQFETFLATAFRHAATYSVDGSIHFQCMDWRHISEIVRAGQQSYTELKNICVWTKSNGGMGSLYRSQHEFIFVFKSGAGAHINNVELGKYGRNRTNVWPYPGATSFGDGRSDLALHPTVKPQQLVADAILDCSNRGAIILDPFAGSGTTLLAAHQTGRRGFGIELDEKYCDVALRRLRDATGTEPVHAGTDETFSEREAATAKAADVEPESEKGAA